MAVPRVGSPANSSRRCTSAQPLVVAGQVPPLVGDRQIHHVRSGVHLPRLRRRRRRRRARAHDCRHAAGPVRKFTNDYRLITDRSRAVHLALLLSLRDGSAPPGTVSALPPHPPAGDGHARRPVTAVRGHGPRCLSRRPRQHRLRRSGSPAAACPPAPAATAGPPACPLFRSVRAHRVTLTFREVERQAAPRRGAPVILIIDDDHLSRDSLAATLSIEGFDVLTASTADGGHRPGVVGLTRRW